VRRICVYCGSNPGRGDVYIDAARSLARLVVERGIGIVYGGAGIGLMGALADAALDAGGEVIGVIPKAIAGKELAHTGLTQLYVVQSMHERKTMMAELSDGFIALPGGLGTLEECFEMLTWGQLGIHNKPCGLLNIDGYFSTLLKFLDEAVEQRFLSAANRAMVLVADDGAALLDAFATYAPPVEEKWLDRDEA
jgi:uncharacterized protein (TIGR00730 family)